jgi:hypothetical protein
MMLYLIFLSKYAMKKMIKNVLSLEIVGINAMETNLDNMEANLDEADKIKHQSDIRNNRDHLNNLKGKNSAEWREYATQCMVEIMENKTQ